MGKNKELGAVERTEREFEIVKFTDRSGVRCSLQASSLAEYEKPGTSAVWLGCEDADPRYFLPDGHGWRGVVLPLPTDAQVVMNTRAHLDRDQVKALIRHLRAWLRNDTFNLPVDI